MSKKKVTLSNRKRLSELQQENSVKTVAEVRREQVESMRHMHVMPEGKLELAVEQMISDVVLELSHSYEQWSQPLDQHRYRFSPNERNRKLLSSLKSFLNEIADWLMSKGIRGVECVEMCQQIVDKIALNLRKKGIPIGALQLHQNNK
ncbi:hypothetical protein [Fangia hongkongensis]|uniref:hypothetical protein n=1 Tax=Fangia hongkongensis TaxID=270495 RepID=UPI00037B6A79|nr:hypothetical protein [Fangia hongkongensis]MBK2125349.1 hypothetical protein [Fangia hongkongensis]